MRRRGPFASRWLVSPPQDRETEAQPEGGDRQPGWAETASTRPRHVHEGRALRRLWPPPDPARSVTSLAVHKRGGDIFWISPEGSLLTLRGADCDS